MKKILITSTTLMLFMIAAGAFGAAPPQSVPATLTYQGSIYVDNAPFSGTGYFKLALVDSTGATVWSNDNTSVGGSEPQTSFATTINEGVFHINMGDTAIMQTLDSSVFNTENTLYLYAWFDDGSHGFSPFNPPIQITSSSYSFNAQFLRGYAPDDFLKFTDQITSAQIAPGAVTSGAIAGGAVGTTQISDGSVTGQKIQAFSSNNTVFTIGSGAAGTNVIYSNQGAANNPALRYESGTWQFSNNGTVWNNMGAGGGGDVFGPAGATDNAVTRFDTASGKLIKNSLVTINNAGTVNIPGGQTYQIGGAALTQDNIGDGATYKQYNPASVAITGGTIMGAAINNTTVGAATASTGKFTTLTADNLVTLLQAAVAIGPFGVGAGNTGEQRFLELAAGGTDYVGFKAPDAIAANVIWTLPNADGSAGNLLSTNGSGVLSWTAAAGGNVTGPGASTDNAVARFDLATGKIIQNSGVIINDTNDVSGIGALSITSMGQNWTNAGHTIADLGSVTTADINGGTIDNTAIGGATAANGTFTNLEAQTTFKLGTTNQGDILYDNGTSIVRLVPGLSGRYLQTQGAGANPQWADAPTAPVSSVFTRTGAVTAQVGDYTWAQIDKTTSSIADITTRSAGDLSSGNLDVARMPTGGSWGITSDLNIDSDTLVVDRTNNRVGIGQASPVSKLQLDVADGEGVAGILVDNNEATNDTAGIVIDNVDGGGIPLVLVPKDLPTATTEGGLYADSATHRLYFRTNSAWIDLTGGGGGVAPADATYITQVPDADLTAEQALSALATGIMQVTTGTGVVSSVTTSAGVASLISDETGTGAMVFRTNPSLTSPSVNTSMTMQTSSWLGLGGGAGRMEFLDEATDKLNILQSNVGIGTSTPSQRLDVAGTTRSRSGFLSSDGAAASPAYSYAADTDTGIFRPAENQIGFSTDGTESMRIDEDGRVAMGHTMTFDPTNPEHLLVDSGTDPSVNVITAYGDINDILRLNIRNRNSGTLAVSTMAASADNSDFSHFAAVGVTSSGFDNPVYSIAGPNDGFLLSMGGDLTVGTAGVGTAIKFHTVGTTTSYERMRIDSAGKVGIGVTGPAAKLEVEVADAEGVRGVLIDNNDSTNDTAGLQIDMEEGDGIPLILTPTASPPSTTVEGGLYANLADHKLYYRTNSAWVDLTSGGGGGAPATATYITQTPDATLTNEQALSALSTGIMQVTTGTGVVDSITDSAGVAGLISDETGTGSMVFGSSPSISSPAISGSPTAAGATWTDLGTVSTAAIEGGTIDASSIGSVTPADGAFTTLSSSGQYTNTVTDGTTPMLITSTTLVSNLNSDFLDGQSGSYYLDIANASITGQAQGDVLYYNGSNWTRLAAGISGEFLKTQGAGANPLWASPAGGGTVNAGLTNQMTYYASDGTAVSGLATANNGVLVTSGAGAPSISSTLPGAVQSNITAVGTVASGAWNGAAVDETHGGTNQTTYSAGDILYASAADTLSKLVIGSVNDVLTVSGGGVPVWAAAAGGGANTTLSNLVSPTSVNQDLLPDSDNTRDLGSGPSSWGDAFIDGTATIATADINGGTIDATTIGATTPAAGTFTNLQSGIAGTSGQITIYSEQGATDYSVILQPNPAMTQTTIYVLPADDGAASQMLTTDGGGNLSWTSAAGSGTVNPGLTNQLAYYTADGTAVSGLATGNNGVLVTSGAGAPSISSTLPGAVQSNITAVGTVASGTWNGTAIDETHGGTNQTTYTAGDILYASALNALSRLGIGSNGDFLTISGGAPAWTSASFANKNLSDLTSPTSVNQDLLPDADNTRDLGSAANSWNDAWLDGTTTIATADINGGTIDAASIGSSTPSTGIFTQLTTTLQAALSISPYGVGSGNTGEVRFFELAATGTNYVGFKAPNSIPINTIWTLPSADGSSGQTLVTNGSGVLSWTSAGSGTITAVGSITSGNAFSNAAAHNQWLGLGAAAGRIEFLDEATDKVNMLQSYVGIGTSTPAQRLDVAGVIRAQSGFSSSDGSAASPAYSYALDTNTGIFRPSADNLAFSTAGAERARISSTGNFAIGTSTFDITNPEHFLVDGGTSTSVNIISARGNLDNYLQLNIQNRNAGTSASSDLVATADNGDETANYIDMGINSSGYNNPDFDITGPNDGYLYIDGGDLAIGTATAGTVIMFHTGGTEDTDERMRIDENGNVGIGTTTVTAGMELDVNGDVNVAQTLTIGGGTAISRHLSATASIDLPNIASRTCDQASLTVTGAAAGNTVVCTPTPTAGGIETLNLSWNCYVSAANTVQVRACNPTTGSLNPPAQTWRADVWQH